MKIIEEKRLEKIREIWDGLQGVTESHPELRKAMFENGVPICLICGALMKNTYDNKLGKISGYLWKCDNPKCKGDKNLRLSVG